MFIKLGRVTFKYIVCITIEVFKKKKILSKFTILLISLGNVLPLFG